MVELGPIFTAGTPRVKSRSEAWLSWVAANLPKYKGEVRPKNNFWRRWKRIRGDWYCFTEIKQYTGDITYLNLYGKEQTFNILEHKESSWGPSYLFDRAMLKNDHKLKEAQVWFHEQVYVYRPLDLEDQRQGLRDIPGQYWTIANAILITKFPMLKQTRYLYTYLSPVECHQAKLIAEAEGVAPGFTLWTPEGPIRKPLNATITGLTLDGVLATDFQSLYDGLEYHGKIAPLAQSLKE